MRLQWIDLLLFDKVDDTKLENTLNDFKVFENPPFYCEPIQFAFA